MLDVFRSVAGKGRRGSGTLRAPLLVALVLGVFVAIAAGGTSLILAAANDMALNANYLDTSRAQQTAEGVLTSMKQQMESTVSDYTAWDDAAQAVYAEHNRTWLQKNYGDLSGTSDLYDTFFLLSPNKTLDMAYANGMKIDSKPSGYFGPSFTALYGAFQAGLARGIYQRTGFISTKDGPAVIGLSAVRSSLGTLTVDPKAVSVVVLARHLNASFINELARNYVIDGLRLLPEAPAEQPFAAVRDALGDVIGAFVWDLRQPGTQSYRRVLPMIAWGLTCIILVLFGLLGFGFVIVRRLSADERAARDLAKRDQLTGLLNRVGLNEALVAIEEQASASGKNAVLIYLDLDRFKEVNDAYGHDVGDQLIRGVTRGLSYLLPPKAVFARIGGDEFAIAFVSGEPDVDCALIDENVTSFFREPLIITDRLASVGASMGIAVSPRGTLGGMELLRQADMAMYRAKATRSGRAVLYNSAMDEDREARNHMARDLRIALDEEALSVVYQPVVDAQSRAVCGVEALVRWNRKGIGAVSPDIFIQVAENNGLIGRLGEFVMRRAFLDAAAWPEISVAVNISPLQLHDDSFVESADRIIEECGFPSHRAILELTEGFFVRNPDRAKLSLASLRSKGLRIALDDFGSGFSSVGYLREFGFDRLKIDRSLINALGKAPKAGDLLKATVALAASFDIPVTAEGIETREQADFLTACGCDELQGYLFSRPVPAADITRAIAARKGNITVA